MKSSRLLTPLQVAQVNNRSNLRTEILYKLHRHAGSYETPLVTN